MALRIGESEDRVVSDINVTPLVDVMLVLLIIFMITAPMLHQGISVVLPEAEARNLPLDREDPLIVSISADGIVYLAENPIHPSQLVERLLPMIEARDNDQVFLEADETVDYGRVVAVLDVLQRGGVSHIGMVTRMPEDRDGG